MKNSWNQSWNQYPSLQEKATFGDVAVEITSIVNLQSRSSKWREKLQAWYVQNELPISSSIFSMTTKDNRNSPSKELGNSFVTISETKWGYAEDGISYNKIVSQTFEKLPICILSADSYSASFVFGHLENWETFQNVPAFVRRWDADAFWNASGDYKVFRPY
jgi:hypothetical protein